MWTVAVRGRTAVDKKLVNTIKSELEEGMALDKCRKCGCMKDALDSLTSSLLSLEIEGSPELLEDVAEWQEQLDEIKYK